MTRRQRMVIGFSLLFYVLAFGFILSGIAMQLWWMLLAGLFLLIAAAQTIRFLAGPHE